ncbi:MAG: hypothetical protein A2Z86_09455 [Candidatus Glassbacteria bacterium GWA2_58_10]|uniref:ABC transporter n=1 Tax=Candidatus Glassbacteria bacterium GWA2_58_10 TaxID=1817865 RepID=A0A1F5YHJ8_9BACT|nr:MAG: hypothetical protein A2Z86_09455 [Candidatus Glassbacteria bacterium GWA2_58_10]
MAEMLSFMAMPFLACIVLLGIHSYFGLHVLKREIIFIDIAMAQVAALGGLLALLAGRAHEGTWAHWLALGMTATAAALFTAAKNSGQRVPQEAVIGVVYAVAATGSILLAVRMPGGGEHLHEALDGSILWTDWSVVRHSTLVYAIVGAFHWVFRKKFIMLSFDLPGARAAGMRIRLWDFLFYFSLGWVLVHSVEIGGVLLVFAILVLPASISSLLAERLGMRILIGWSVGAASCALALFLSWKLDLPSGPAVICVLGAVLLLTGVARKLAAAR